MKKGPGPFGYVICYEDAGTPATELLRELASYVGKLAKICNSANAPSFLSDFEKVVCFLFLIIFFIAKDTLFMQLQLSMVKIIFQLLVSN